MGDVDVSLGGAGRNHCFEGRVLLRRARGKGQVLELLFEVLHAEAVRERCVNFERLSRNALLFLRWHCGDGLHVVQPIGELDDQHTSVLGDRQHHLARRRCLLGFLGVEVHSVELGDTIDDVCDVVAELLGDGFQIDRGVLDRIV